ncbi:MAG: glycosyltransferase family 4 protein [Candidatus Brocadiae bacterium]|nr:glycosyltransferase family 4 protein [Candidatus Brocadiia bacterium]
MKVLMLGMEYSETKGQIQSRYIADICEALAQNSVEVHLISLGFDEEKEKILRHGVHIHSIHPFEFQSFHWVSDAVLNNVPLLEKSISIAETQPFDLVVAHDWLAALTAKSLKTIYEIPLIITIHDIEIGEKQNQLTREEYYIAEMEGWICQHADQIITTSHFMQKQLSDVYKIPASHIAVVQYGITPDSWTTQCNLKDFRRLFAPDKDKIVLFTGTLSMAQGPQVLLQAAEQVLKKIPDTTFIFSGQGELAQELAQKAQKLQGNILFPGLLQGKALAATYQIADCLVIPALYEPSGMAALQAMLCKTPVIVSDTGILSELIEHNSTGLKVTPFHPEALAQAIITLLCETQLSQNLALNAREQVLNRHLWHNIARQMEEIYQRVIDIKKTRKTEIYFPKSL